MRSEAITAQVKHSVTTDNWVQYKGGTSSVYIRMWSADAAYLRHWYSLRKTVEKSVINTGYAYVTLEFSFRTLEHQLPWK